MSQKICWVVTKAGYRGISYGWKLHAVPSAPGDATVVSACGLIRQWSADLFVEKKCAHCLRKLGLACKICKGTSRAPKDANSMHCFHCVDGEAQ